MAPREREGSEWQSGIREVESLFEALAHEFEDALRRLSDEHHDGEYRQRLHAAKSAAERGAACVRALLADNDD